MDREAMAVAPAKGAMEVAASPWPETAAAPFPGRAKMAALVATNMGAVVEAAAVASTVLVAAVEEVAATTAAAGNQISPS